MLSLTHLSGAAESIAIVYTKYAIINMTRNHLRVSQRIATKLNNKHHVAVQEVWECFMNRTAGFLEDTRLAHKTEPPTLWFIAETDSERLLKVVFIERDDGLYELKTAYEPNSNEVKLYEKYA